MAKVAKTVKQVKEWIKQPHHVGEALTKDRKRDPKPGEVYYLKLSGHSPTKGYPFSFRNLFWRNASSTLPAILPICMNGTMKPNEPRMKRNPWKGRLRF